MKNILVATILAVSTMVCTPAMALEDLTPYQAAYFDYALDKGYDVPNELIDKLNEFIFSGHDDSLREFVKQRDRYDDTYDSRLDCRNPDIDKAVWTASCT